MKLDTIFENLGQIVDVLGSNFVGINLAFAGFAWLALLLPTSFFEPIGVVGLREDLRAILGAMALVSSYLLLLWLVWRGMSLGYAWVRAMFELTRLSVDERHRLQSYCDKQTHTATFSQTDGVVALLVLKGLLYKSDAKPNAQGEQDYHIYSWVLHRLMQEPQLLQPTTEGDTNGGNRH
jgi:hypothetical protein